MEEKNPVCGHCGVRKSAHYAVNYADTPMATSVAGVTLICPRNTFVVATEPPPTRRVTPRSWTDADRERALSQPEDLDE